MITGKTKTGFQFSLKDKALDDYELLEVLQEIDSGDYTHVTKMVNMLLGEKQANDLKEHVRDKDGRVSASSMIMEITDVFESSAETKN